MFSITTHSRLDYNITMASCRRIISLPLIFLVVLGFNHSLMADDEVVLIQAVSTTGKTFIIRRGAEDGISFGQESLFSTKNSSFTARAIEVNRNLSLWKLKDKRGAVPFGKGDFVTYTNNIENVWTEIPKIQLAPKQELVFKESSNWLFQGNYSLAMSEAVSDTSESKTTDRVGYQFEFLYARRFAVHWEWATGFRLDRENATLQEPALDVPTNRYLATAQITYHFENFKNSDDNLYLSIAASYGISNTSIDDAVSTGTTLVLPVVKFGYISVVSPNYSLYYELAAEGLAQEESFTDTTAQTTNIINTKASIGIRF